LALVAAAAPFLEATPFPDLAALLPLLPAEDPLLVDLWFLLLLAEAFLVFRFFLDCLLFWACLDPTTLFELAPTLPDLFLDWPLLPLAPPLLDLATPPLDDLVFFLEPLFLAPDLFPDEDFPFPEDLFLAGLVVALVLRVLFLALPPRLISLIF